MRAFFYVRVRFMRTFFAIKKASIMLAFFVSPNREPLRNHSARMNVTFMLTRYSTILPPLMITF